MKLFPIAMAWAALCITAATPAFGQLEAKTPHTQGYAFALALPLNVGADETPASKSGAQPPAAT